jgi:transposase
MYRGSAAYKRSAARRVDHRRISRGFFVGRYAANTGRYAPGAARPHAKPQFFALFPELFLIIRTKTALTRWRELSEPNM